jgi:hypothetical protein
VIVTFGVYGFAKHLLDFDYRVSIDELCPSEVLKPVLRAFYCIEFALPERRSFHHSVLGSIDVQIARYFNIALEISCKTAPKAGAPDSYTSPGIVAPNCRSGEIGMEVVTPATPKPPPVFSP